MNRPIRGERRRGYALLETVGGAVVLIVAVGVTVRMLGWVAAERRSAERRQWATHEAANAMERLAGRPWETLTAESVGAESLSPSALEILPGGRLGVALKEDGALKRLTVEVRWRGRSGADEAPVRLSAWVARGKEDRR